MTETLKKLPKLENTSIRMDFGTEEAPALLLTLLDEDGIALTDRVDNAEVENACGCWACVREALYEKAKENLKLQLQ